MLKNTAQINAMINLVQRYHDGQFRTPSKIPYWHHLVSVTEILEESLTAAKEMSGEKAETVLLAALGHDLYEDTKIEPAEIKKLFGDDVHNLIELMTNRRGDHDRADYVDQIKAAPEEVKLIKLADLTENTTSASQRVHELGAEWVNTFFRPIIEEMSEQVRPEKFSTYPKTAEILWGYYSFAYRRLLDNTARWEK
jgi:(p)ppGpp synthase/HD superfamily hydrolase